MVLKLGYDNTESENKVYVTYRNEYYAEFLSRFLKEPRRINRPLELEISKVNSAFGIKYQALFKNFFFFRRGNQVFSFNAEVSQKYKMMKLVNFDISPHLKLSCTNNKLPITLSLKRYSIQASRNQVFEGNDFSEVLGSLLPYNVSSISVDHSKSYDFWLFKTNQLFLYKFKATLGSIQNLQDYIKLTFGYKTIVDIPLPIDWFSIGINSENYIKRSFKRQSNWGASTLDDHPNIHHHDKHLVKQCHVITNFECFSKLLGINILSKDGEFDNGVNFYLQSHNSIRIKNIKLFRDYEILNRLEPYLGFEFVYRPITEKLRKNFIMIGSLGFSLKVQEGMYLDFMIKSWSFNSSIDHKKINKFRMGIEFSTNL